MLNIFLWHYILPLDCVQEFRFIDFFHFYLEFFIRTRVRWSYLPHCFNIYFWNYVITLRCFSFLNPYQSFIAVSSFIVFPCFPKPVDYSGPKSTVVSHINKQGWWVNMQPPHTALWCLSTVIFQAACLLEAV